MTRRMTVVLAANGYPGAYEKGTEIKGLDDAASDRRDPCFTPAPWRRGDKISRRRARPQVTARRTDIAEAQQAAYAAVDAIDWPDGFCRRDIGWRAIS